MNNYILNGLTTYVENQHSRTPPNMFKGRSKGQINYFYTWSYDDFAAKEILKLLKQKEVDIINYLRFLIEQFDEKCSKCSTRQSKNIFISFHEVSMELLDIAIILKEDYEEKGGN